MKTQTLIKALSLEIADEQEWPVGILGNKIYIFDK